MGIFRLGHKHVSPETLTEYLDGRLRSKARERLESVISGCADCRQELAGLRETVAMLRQLPVVTPRRSFVMAAPPVEVPQPRPISPFRVPQWTYAGAASLAALVLAVLVSVDASGLMAPGLPDTAMLSRSNKTVTQADSEVSRQEIAGAKGGAQVELESAAEAPAVAEAQAEAPAAAVMEAQAPAAADMQAATSAKKILEAPVSGLQAVEEPAVKSAQGEQAAQPDTQPERAESAPVQLEQASPAQAETAEVLPLPTAVSDGAAPEPAQVQEPIITLEELKKRVTRGTPVIWRLLEAAVAVLFLVLAAVFFVRRRAARRF